MTILSAQSIKLRIKGYVLRRDNTIDEAKRDERLVIKPFLQEPEQVYGLSYGLSSCGYDIRIGAIDRRIQSKQVDSYRLLPSEFLLCSSLEYFELPHDLCARVLDKSTLARKGLALQNTVCEPGWRGHITLELSNHSHRTIRLRVGQPIAQVLFELLDLPTNRPYEGKYQDQANKPVHAIMQGSVDTDG